MNSAQRITLWTGCMVAATVMLLSPNDYAHYGNVPGILAILIRLAVVAAITAVVYVTFKSKTP